MGIRGIRRLAVATLACLGLAVSLPAAGEDAAQADTLEQGAGSLARDLVDQLLRHTDTHGQRLALQPLEPEAFKGLNEHGRGELHELLVRSLGSEIRDSYRLVNPRRFRDISRMLENSGTPPGSTATSSSCAEPKPISASPARRVLRAGAPSS